MSYDFQIKRPMQTVELKINMMFDENLHLTKTMQRSVNHPLTEKKAIFQFQIKTNPYFEKIQYCHDS